jgi:hypothetical protein
LATRIKPVLFRFACADIRCYDIGMDCFTNIEPAGTRAAGKTAAGMGAGDV